MESLISAGPSGGSKAGRARLQGWAILENFSGQAWHDVSLTLLSGNPVTFRQSLFERYYVARPNVPVEVAGRVLPKPDTGSIESELGARDAANPSLLGCRRRPGWPALSQKRYRHQLRLRAPRRRSRLLKRQKA